MKINHIGIWTNQLEEMKMFYFIFFNGKSNEKYVNPAKDSNPISSVLKTMLP